MPESVFPAENRAVRITLAVSLVVLAACGVAWSNLPAQAEKYQSRLSSLLLKKSTLYLPTRLVIGEEARFVVKAQPGDKVKVLLSPEGDGYVLPSGQPLRVGAEAQELTGTIPENGVLELKLDMPKGNDLDGKVLYIDAAGGPSDEQMAPLDLIDATGRRATSNVLVITKVVDRGGPPIMPTIPGVTPQMFNQITQVGDIYSTKDENRKQLLDNGDINRDRRLDTNPFVNRGIQPGLR